MAAAESPIDWRRAEQIATRIADRHGEHATSAAIDVSYMVSRLEDQIESTTGLRSLSGPASVGVIDRPAWIRANISSFQHLLEPLIEQWSASSDRPCSVHQRADRWCRTGCVARMDEQPSTGQYDSPSPDDLDDAVHRPELAGLEKRLASTLWSSACGCCCTN